MVSKSRFPFCFSQNLGADHQQPSKIGSQQDFVHSRVNWISKLAEIQRKLHLMAKTNFKEHDFGGAPDQRQLFLRWTGLNQIHVGHWGRNWFLTHIIEFTAGPGSRLRFLPHAVFQARLGKDQRVSKRCFEFNLTCLKRKSSTMASSARSSSSSPSLASSLVSSTLSCGGSSASGFFAEAFSMAACLIDSSECDGNGFENSMQIEGVIACLIDSSASDVMAIGLKIERTFKGWWMAACLIDSIESGVMATDLKTRWNFKGLWMGAQSW